MTKTIKLGPKQLAILNDIQARKKQVQEAFNHLQDKEQILMESIFENEKVTEQPTGVKLEGDSLILEFAEEKKEEAKTKTKKNKEKELVTN